MCGSVQRLGLLCAGCLAQLIPTSAAVGSDTSAVVRDLTPVAVRRTDLEVGKGAADRWASILDSKSGAARDDLTKRKLRMERSFVENKVFRGLAEEEEEGASHAHQHKEEEEQHHEEGVATAEQGGEHHDDHDEEHDDHDDEHEDEGVKHFEGDGHDHGEEGHDDENILDQDGHDDHSGHDSHDDHSEHDSHDDHSGHDSHDDHSDHEHDHSSLEARVQEGQVNKPWKEVILSTLIINILALVGIVILAPGIGRARILCLTLLGKNKKTDSPEPQDNEQSAHQSGSNKKKSNGLIVDIAIPSFAAGALLAASVFLILPEAIRWIEKGVVAATEVDLHEGHGGHRLLQDGHDGHGDEEKVQAEWRFGASVLGGFLLPMVLGALFPRASKHVCDDECGESPNLRKNAAAEALIPPENLDASVVGLSEDHCCHCEVEAIEKGAGNHPKTVRIDVRTVVSHCPTCDEEACVGGGDDLLDKSGSGEETSGSCKGKQCCNESDHDYGPDHGATGDHCSEDHAHSHDKFHDETDHAGKSAHNPDRRLSKSTMSISSFAKVCRHGARASLRRRNVRHDINYRLCASILIGDGFHNYADGIFIGIAFMLCSQDVAISIMAITLYHEVAQELADFFLLTRHAGLGVASALALNFCSGLSVMLGGITILAVNLTAQAIGVILCVSAGVYIHIAASECIPRVDGAAKNWKDRALSFLMFLVGAIPIGLALINHQHCEG